VSSRYGPLGDLMRRVVFRVAQPILVQEHARLAERDRRTDALEARLSRLEDAVGDVRTQLVQETVLLRSVLRGIEGRFDELVVRQDADRIVDQLALVEHALGLQLDELRTEIGETVRYVDREDSRLWERLALVTAAPDGSETQLRGIVSHLELRAELRGLERALELLERVDPG